MTKEITVNEAKRQMLHYINNEMSDCVANKITKVILTRHYEKMLLNFISDNFKSKTRRQVDVTDPYYFDRPNSVCSVRIINGKLFLGKEKRDDTGKIVYSTDLYHFDLLNRTQKDIKSRAYEKKKYKSMWIHTIEGMITYHETVKTLRSQSDKEMLTRFVVGASEPLFVAEYKSPLNKYMLITQELLDSGLTHYYGYIDEGENMIDTPKPLHVGDYLVSVVDEDGCVLSQTLTEYEFKLRFTTK